MTQAVVLPANRDSKQGASDDVEALASAWTTAFGPGSLAGFGWKRVTADPTSHFFRGPAADGETDLYLISPPLSVATGPFRVTFKQRHLFNAQGAEAYEGGVIELSTDDGQTWTDVGGTAMPGYQGMVNTGGGRNVLSGRRAYIGTSPGYPAWVSVSLDLGASYAGRTVKLRFRLATDDGGACLGWDLDDFVFTGLLGTPFTSLTAEPATCTQRRPIAVVESAGDANADDKVVLDGSKSFDLDGDPLQFQWRQVSGPDVSLTGASTAQASFLAPRTSGTTLEFELVVNDGKADSKPVRTTVRVAAGSGQRGGCGCSGAPVELWLVSALAVLLLRRRG